MPDATARIAVWVTPGAATDDVVGLREGAVHIRVSEPAREGRANAAVEELVASRLKVPKGRVRVVRGLASRRKQVAVQGLTSVEVLRLLGLQSPSSG